MLILTVITARGGSVTLPRKNVLPFCGRPLIASSIEVAQAARDSDAGIDRIIVSTDDPEIANVSRRFGAEVPFMRPAELAQPNTPSLPVVQHAVNHIEQVNCLRYDWILVLQPTSPLRSKDDVCAALALAGKPETTAVISVTTANDSHPAKLKLIDGGLLRPYWGRELQQPRRQDFGDDVYKTNGAIYLVRRDVLMLGNSFYGDKPRPLIMPRDRSIDIDTALDFAVAEFLYQRQLNVGTHSPNNTNPCRMMGSESGRLVTGRVLSLNATRTGVASAPLLTFATFSADLACRILPRFPETSTPVP